MAGAGSRVHAGRRVGRGAVAGVLLAASMTVVGASPVGAADTGGATATPISTARLTEDVQAPSTAPVAGPAQTREPAPAPVARRSGAVTASTPGAVLGGTRVTVNGSTGTPVARAVRLLRWDGTAWVKVAEATSAGDGSFSLTDPMARVGDYKVKAPKVKRSTPRLKGAESAPMTVKVTNTLEPGTTLNPGNFVVSADGQYRLIMQGDGNLVAYGPSGAVWATYTNGTNRRAVMQGDGNLVVYEGPKALWDAQTGGFAGARLVMQTDGNVVIYEGGRAIWSRHDGTLYDRLMTGQRLEAGQSLWSRGRGYRLVMQGDGNLVVYKGGVAQWSTQTGGTGEGATLVMQGDGNAVVYRAGGVATWASKTQGAGHRLVMQSDGNLVVYAGSTPKWSRNDTPASNPGGGASGGDGYPDVDAVDCSAQHGIYSWCKNGSVFSSRRFAYRNCTDYVAWRKGLVWGDVSSGGSGHAKAWRQGWIDRGRTVSSTPRVGAIAWWGTGDFGHVAYVVAINSDGSARVAEYNYGGTGTYHERNVRAQAYLY